MMVQVNEVDFSNLLTMAANYESMMYLNLSGGILIGLVLMKLFTLVQSK